jgi:hypothetical protein
MRQPAKSDRVLALARTNVRWRATGSTGTAHFGGPETLSQAEIAPAIGHRPNLDAGDSGSKPMRKPAKDKIREDRIHNEAIVDANGSEDKAMSWYYYLENKIRFPFQAKCIVANLASPIKKGETAEVRRLAPDDACSTDILVLIRWQGRSMAAPLSQLAPVDPDESTAEAIGDWHY